jgi:quinol monooxygenase YgiN
MQTAGLATRDLSDGFVVAINIEAKEGQADTVAAILTDLIAPTMAEPGTKIYMPYRSPANPSRFFIFELYVDEDGWAAHQETVHFKAAIEQLLPRVARRERVPFVPIAPV